MALPITQRGSGMVRPPLTSEVVGMKLPQTASSPEAAQYAVVRLKEELTLRRFDNDYISNMVNTFNKWAGQVTQFSESPESAMNLRATQACSELDPGARYQAHFAVSNEGEYQRVWLSQTGEVLPENVIKALDKQVDASMASRGLTLRAGRFIEVGADGNEQRVNPDKARDILQNRVKRDLEQRGVSLGSVYLHDYQQPAQKAAAAQKVAAERAKPSVNPNPEPAPEQNVRPGQSQSM